VAGMGLSLSPKWWRESVPPDCVPASSTVGPDVVRNTECSLEHTWFVLSSLLARRQDASLTTASAVGCVVFAENLAMAAGYSTGDIGLRATACAVVLFAALIHAFAPKLGVRIMVCWSPRSSMIWS
jgi:hypothetical protein